MNDKRTRLTPAGRFALILALLLGGAVAGAAGATATKPHAQAWRCVLVRPGDTLWGLARAVSPREDPRVVIEKISRRNDLAGTPILPGDALWVPWSQRVRAGSLTECGVVP